MKTDISIMNLFNKRKYSFISKERETKSFLDDRVEYEICSEYIKREDQEALSHC